MRTTLFRLSAVLAFVALSPYAPRVAPNAVAAATGPHLRSIGPLSFGPDGLLLAADSAPSPGPLPADARYLVVHRALGDEMNLVTRAALGRERCTASGRRLESPDVVEIR